MITLKNVSRQPFVVTLYCKLYCQQGAPCGGTQQAVTTDVTLPSGERGVQVNTVCAPPAVRIEPGGMSAPLHEKVLEIQQVASAVKGPRAQLRVFQVAPPAPTLFTQASVVAEVPESAVDEQVKTHKSGPKKPPSDTRSEK